MRLHYYGTAVKATKTSKERSLYTFEIFFMV